MPPEERVCPKTSATKQEESKEKSIARRTARFVDLARTIAV
jgi:hypothetical protein